MNNLQLPITDKYIDTHFVFTGAFGMIGSSIANMLHRTYTIGGLKPSFEYLVRRYPSQDEIQRIPAGRVVQLSEINRWRPRKVNFTLVHLASPASPRTISDAGNLRDANLGILESIVARAIPTSILYSSTAGVYDSLENKPMKESSPLRESSFIARASYPSAKLEVENWLQNSHSLYGFEFTITRIFHTFGPGLRQNDGRSFGDFLWSAAEKKPLRLRSDGSDIRSFAYSEDTAAAMILALTSGAPNEAYNVGSEEALTILEFASRVADIFQVHLEFTNENRMQSDNYMHSEDRYLVPDLQKIMELGWTQTFALDEAIEETVFEMRRRL